MRRAKIISSFFAFLFAWGVAAKPLRPRLFVTERLDGPGATLHSLLYAIGVAARYDMEFAGVLTRPTHISHSINITHFAIRVLGLPESSIVHQVPEGVTNFSSVASLESHASQLVPGKPYLLTCHSVVKETGLEGVRERRPGTTLDEYLTPKLLERIKRHWLKKNSTYEQTMAVHVRRGTKHKSLTPDSHFLSLIDMYREVANSDASVHVYSLNDKSPETGFNRTKYVRNYVYTHLAFDGHNEDYLLDIWDHFAQAGVMVVDTSSFSWFPSFFNTNCVIYHPYRVHGMTDRLAPSHWVPSDQPGLVRECMQRHVDRVRKSQGVL